MRSFALGLILSAVAVPCVAQTVLKSEPLSLAPYEVVLVQDVSCTAGKVLKVTGAIRGLHRRKICVSLAAEQASDTLLGKGTVEAIKATAAFLKEQKKVDALLPSYDATVTVEFVKAVAASN